MSVPGLAILYSGLMKRKWALNSALMVLYAFGATLVVWTFWAYKMSFGDALVGSLHFIGKPGTILSSADLQGQAGERSQSMLVAQMLLCAALEYGALPKA